MMSLDPATARGVARTRPVVPSDAEGPVFNEPWEAKAFAIALSLHERHLFTWNEWAAALADEISRAQGSGEPDTGETYYHHWVRALERLAADKGWASGAMLHRYREAWAHAAGRTPHGLPIELSSDDLGHR